MDVLEAEDERVFPGKRLADFPHSPERLLAADVRSTRHAAEPLDHELRVVRAGKQALDRLVAAGVAKDLRERPERDPIAVRETAADEDVGFVRDVAEELAREP